MDLAGWLSLFAVCLLGAMSPGPSLAVIVEQTLARGRRAGLLTAVAHGAGVACYALLTIAGLAVVIARSPGLFSGLQVAGAGYLIYLGLGALGTAARDGGGTVTESHGITRSPVVSGFLIALLNPKLALFMLSLFSQFLSAGASPATHAGMVAVAGITDAVWYCLAATLVSHPRVLTRLRARGLWIERIFGGLLCLLGLTVLSRVAWSGLGG